jgi:cephalosporin hydroxylase
MKLTIDTDNKTLHVIDSDCNKQLPLYGKESFEILSRQWLKVGWNQKYPYTFAWLGRPIIQAPEDLIRVQEVIYRVKPDLIVETGVAHGGSLIFYAGLFRAMGTAGRVIGVDIEIRPHNRVAIEKHELAPGITLIEGSSTAPETVRQVKAQVRAGERVMVILDSCHTKGHVRAELEAYCDLVSPGSYIVATDGSMRDLYDVPRGRPEWQWDNPTEAAAEFVGRHPEFVMEQPAWPFNESDLSANITHWPNAWLRKE